MQAARRETRVRRRGKKRREEEGRKGREEEEGSRAAAAAAAGEKPRDEERIPFHSLKCWSNNTLSHSLAHKHSPSGGQDRQMTRIGSRFGEEDVPRLVSAAERPVERRQTVIFGVESPA